MKTNKVALAIVAGFAAGAILGVLFAPDKGSATRNKIAKTGQQYADSLSKTFDEFVESLTEQFEALQEEAARVAEQTKANINSQTSEAS